MANNATVKLQWGALPLNFAPGTWDVLVSELAKIVTAYVPGTYNFFNYGDATPDAADQDKPWLRTIAGVPDRWYVYSGGYWVAQHENEPAGIDRRIVVGTLNQVKLLDREDEDVNEVSTDIYTGPFWEVDSTFVDRVPKGVGDGEAAGDTGGSNTAAIAIENLPATGADLTLPFWVPDVVLAGGDVVDAAQSGVTTDAVTGNKQGVARDGESRENSKVSMKTDPLGDGKALTIEPANVSVYFIKRTSRRFYRI